MFTLSFSIYIAYAFKQRGAEVAQRLTQQTNVLAAVKQRLVDLEQERTNAFEQATKDAIDFYEEELQYMGSELHDDLVQRLAAHRLIMHRLDLSEDVTELQAIAHRLKSDFPEIVRSVNRISRRLMPDDLVHGSFFNSLQGLCAKLGQRGLGHLHLTQTGKEFQLGANHELHLFRIVQELIHNTTKHSTAWHIWIRLYWTDQLVMELEDDGTKTDLRLKLDNPRAFRTIRARALKCGATVTFGKGKERGLLITIIYNPEYPAGGINFQVKV